MEYSTFRGILFLSYLFIFLDLIINVLGMAIRLQNVHELLLYVVQDTVLMFTIIIIFLLFSNTYIFQAGFVGMLVNKYKCTIICSFIYLSLSIPLHVIVKDGTIFMNMSGRIQCEHFIFSKGYVSSVFHYFLFKRTVLCFADSRYYRNSSWLQERMNKGL
uniref:Transmembrane protein 138 n=1 Tax=Strigamia maritima TaxID=126957 RepID=T1J760_STRMM